MFRLGIDDEIARLWLDRPEARNAIPVEGWGELAVRAGEAEGGGARVLILSGEPGGAFCAGADLGGFDAFRGDAQARSGFREAMRTGLDRLRGLPIPTIAVIEGACYGAGVAVALACDIRIAGPRARFAITPAKLGISYPQEDVHRLVGLVGFGQAARLLFGAGTIDAAEGARIGFIELLEQDPVEAAETLARSITANDGDSLSALKRAIRLAASGVESDEEQNRLFDDLLGSDALFERLAARRERRRG